MRNVLSTALIELAHRPDFLFFTGDLGFQALEPLRAAAGDRFINAGVAEQNMISAAAGAAWTGLRPWVYSIAPFVYARPFEQIRNDICLHDLPVKLVGNGGGYAYGVMGATHHALQDYGSLLSLDHMHAFVPAFAVDVPEIIQRLILFPHPAYLRLGRCELPADFILPGYAPWRQLLHGDGPAMVVIGPLAGGILAAVQNLPDPRRPNFWVVSELPLRTDALPAAFLAQLQRTGRLLVVEEHVVQGSAGQMLAHLLLELGVAPAQFTHRCAQGYPTGLYGSQKYHRRQSGLDPESIVAELCT